MPGPSLVRWMFVLITVGSSGPGVLSLGAAACPAFARMAQRWAVLQLDGVQLLIGRAHGRKG